MSVLVINCGSSSIKYQLFDTANDTILAKGGVERIGAPGSFITQHTSHGDYRIDTDMNTHHAGFQHMIAALTDDERGAISDLSSVEAVGHRVVHGGDKLVESCLATPEVIEELESCVPLAPLHTPAHLVGIREAIEALPHVPQVLVFDTSFHQTMPSRAALYPLPKEYATKHKVRKYGFHGSSYRYVCSQVAQMLDTPLTDHKMVVCHLGNGSSVAAIDGGACIDTSMGLTPLEGLMMGTRTGDIDPAVVFFLERQLGMSADKVDDLFNKKSGLLGVSGVSQDVRDLIDRANEGDERCALAVEMFAYRVRKYIGAYAAAMEGIDTLVFTAGIGENSPAVRTLVCEPLAFLGIELDQSRNEEGADARLVSTEDSRVNVLVVPTDEERVIVEDTLRVAGLE